MVLLNCIHASLVTSQWSLTCLEEDENARSMLLCRIKTSMAAELFGITTLEQFLWFNLKCVGVNNRTVVKIHESSMTIYFWGQPIILV